MHHLPLPLHLLLLLPLLPGLLAGPQYDGVGVDDIFGEQSVQQVETYSFTAPETRCDELRACVECSAFHQYWHNFASALECSNACSQWTFINEPSSREGMCTMQYEPHCGIDGRVYSNKCEAESDGIGIACRGECPCASEANVCSFQGNLDGDTICSAYSFVIEESKVYVWRPPCLADDLEVNGGIWRGETTEVGYDTFPNGWGVLEYAETDHLNREKYDGTMATGMMQGYGNLFWKDGTLYSGQFVNNTKAGEGTMFYPNGDVFSGEWKEERKDGAGRYIYSKGGEYVGGFKGGLKEGEGTCGVEHMEYSYKGQYKGGERTGGEYSITSGDVYSGNFDVSLGTFAGEGTYTWACGKEYSGDFAHGLPHGVGQLTHPDGWSYDGAFDRGRLSGQGMFTWPDGSHYDGEFLPLAGDQMGGAMTGAGDYHTPEGGVYREGRYYPDKTDLTMSYEAMFDGTTLKYKVPAQAKGVAKGGAKGGYGK